MCERLQFINYTQFALLCGHLLYISFLFHDHFITMSNLLWFYWFCYQKIIVDLALKITITCVNNNIVCFTSVICSSLYYNNFKTLRFYNWHFLYLLPWSCIVYYHINHYPRKIWMGNNGETSHRETLFSMRDNVTTSNKHCLPATLRKVWITLLLWD